MSIVMIGKVLGLDVKDEDDVSPAAARLRRIREKVRKKFGDAGYEEEVLAAEQAASDEGANALISAFAQCLRIGVPEEKVYKIARSEKGKRIEMVSESGVRFSFGPKWCEAVKAIKGIALNENNREKLNMHGTYLGFETPEKMSARELCTAIAATL